MTGRGRAGVDSRGPRRGQGEYDRRRGDFRRGLVVIVGAILACALAAVWSFRRGDASQSACLALLDDGIRSGRVQTLEEAAHCQERLARRHPLRSTDHLFAAAVARSFASEVSPAGGSRWPADLRGGLAELSGARYGAAATAFTAAAAAGGPSARTARRFAALAAALAERDPATLVSRATAPGST